MAIMRATMSAARLHAWGRTDQVQIDEVEIPKPGPDEVLIHVRAASVNPVDWAVVKGAMRERYSLPVTPGWDVAGEVGAVGANVEHLHAGDSAYGVTAGGGFAQFALAPGKNITQAPRNLTMLEAAAVPVVAETAWQALFHFGQLSAGQKILIHGASGGVTHIAVQLARWKGAYVVATASGENEEFVHALGADQFINYHQTRFEDVVKDADVVLDTIGGETLERSYDAVKRGGIVVTITGKPDEERAKARGILAVAASRGNADRTQLDEITHLIDAGRLKPVVTAAYPLDHVQDALDAIGTHHTRGKIVVTVPDGEV